jgi:hypothetical protein
LAKPQFSKLANKDLLRIALRIVLMKIISRLFISFITIVVFALNAKTLEASVVYQANRTSLDFIPNDSELLTDPFYGPILSLEGEHWQDMSQVFQPSVCFSTWCNGDKSIEYYMDGQLYATHYMGYEPGYVFYNASGIDRYTSDIYYTEQVDVYFTQTTVWNPITGSVRDIQSTYPVAIDGYGLGYLSITNVVAAKKDGTLYVYLGDLRSQYPRNAGGLYELTPIPVPAAIWCMGSGLIGLAGTSRRKK